MTGKGKSKTLLIDAGNTRLKWSVLQCGKLGHASAYVYDWSNLVEQLNGQFSTLVEDGSVSEVLVCNVAGSRVANAVTTWADFHKARLKIVQVAAEAYGVRNGYTQPQNLGVDRWVALVAARHHVSGPVCIADCGSALTVDVMAADGAHHGGIIVPGRSMMRQSLAANTSALPEVTEGEGSLIFLGKDTVSGIQAGLDAAAVGAISQVVNYARSQFSQPIRGIITGGDAKWVLPYLPQEFQYEPEWVLQGLAVIAEGMGCG